MHETNPFYIFVPSENKEKTLNTKIMAALQNIRNKGGVLVSIVIGIALLAFIIDPSILGTPGQSRNNVGEIAGKTIKIQDYQQRILENEEMIKQMNGIASLTEEDQVTIRENTWQQMISEIIMTDQYEELGIGLSGDELYDLLLGNNMTPAVAQLFADPATGQVDKQRAIETIKYLINSPAGTPQREYWLNMEQQIKTSQLQMKYMLLLAKGLFVTDAEARAYLEDAATNVDISYIMKSYNTVSDSAVSVTSGEIKKYYDEHLYLFEQPESRQIAYVNFDIAASAEDIKETEEWVGSLKEEFAEASDVLEFANLSSEERAVPRYYKEGEFENEGLNDFLFKEEGDGVYGPYMQGNTYNIARVADRRMLPDSVKARHILIQPTQASDVEAFKELADSLAQVIRDGGDFEEIARQYSADQASAVNGGDLGWFTQEQMIQPFSDSVFFAKKREVKVVTTQYGFHIVQVTDMTKPVEKVLLGIVTKEISPSEETINKVYNDARTFVNGVNTEAEFNEAVTKYNQTKRLANLNKNDQSIAGIDNGREIIREAYLTDEVGRILMTGDKSPIFEAGDKFVVAVLLDIREEGVSPINMVSSLIQRELIRQKKGEIIAGQLEKAVAGSESLLSVAQKAGAEVMDATDVNFGSLQIPGAGIEPEVIAEVVRMGENKISQPIVGNQGVYVVVVNAKNTTEVTPEQVEEAKLQMVQLNINRINYQLLPALEKKEGVVDERYKFY